MSKHLSNLDFSLKTEYIDGEPVTYKVIESPKAVYSYFTVDENNDLVYIKGRYEFDTNNKKMLVRYYGISRKLKETGHFSKETNKVTICSKTYAIKSIPSNTNKFEIINKTIYLHLTKIEKQYEIFKKACEYIAHQYMDKRVMYWAKKMKAKVTKISFKNVSSKFAYYSYPSCKVTFSLFVLAFDLDTIDYLIIHELSHYFYQDHSANFWMKVSEFCPEYKKYEKVLNFEH